MIKTTDLMLGNYVVCRVGGNDSEKRSIPMKVVALFDDCSYLDFDENDGDVWEEYDKDLFGIEITEELLLKIGFEKDSEVSYIYKHKERNLDIYKNDYYWCFFFEGNDSGTPLNFLHQLQNAYHLLTGKYLEVKL